MIFLRNALTFQSELTKSRASQSNSSGCDGSAPCVPKFSAVATKPRGRNDVYTMMLFITFAAILAGCILLYLDYDEYGKQAAPTTQPPKVEKLGEDASKTAGAGGTTPKTGGNTGD